MTRSRDALAALVANGPSCETPQMVGELLAADKRLSSYLALVPFVGPLLIQRSEVHTAKEKFWLTWISIGLTSLAVLGLVSTLPTPENRLANLHHRIDRQMKVLGDFAGRYHTEHAPIQQALRTERLLRMIGCAPSRPFSPHRDAQLRGKDGTDLQFEIAPLQEQLGALHVGPG